MTLPPKAARPKNKHFHETVWFFGLGTTTGLPKTTWPQDHFGIAPAQLLLLSGPGPTKRQYHSMLKCFLGRLGYQGQKPTRFQKGVVLGPAAFGGKANTAPVSNKCCFF